MIPSATPDSVSSCWSSLLWYACASVSELTCRLRDLSLLMLSCAGVGGAGLPDRVWPGATELPACARPRRCGGGVAWSAPRPLTGRLAAREAQGSAFGSERGGADLEPGERHPVLPVGDERVACCRVDEEVSRGQQARRPRRGTARRTARSGGGAPCGEAGGPSAPPQ